MLKKIINNDLGATLVEYAMLVVLIGVICIGAMEMVGVRVGSMFEDEAIEQSLGGTGDPNKPECVSSFIPC